MRRIRTIAVLAVVGLASAGIGWSPAGADDFTSFEARATADRDEWALLAAKSRDWLRRQGGPAGPEAWTRAWSPDDFYVPLAAELSLWQDAGLSPEVSWRRDSFAVIVATA